MERKKHRAQEEKKWLKKAQEVRYASDFKRADRAARNAKI
ncbi:YfhE family protein [Halalkalibacterium ligniniphilum]|nr:YfhE family protein [Halalkalibacterium ligniniphilum]